MSKELKKLVVNELISEYRGINNIIVVNFKGINAHQANVLRKSLSEKEVELRVVKNSLAAVAFKEIGVPELSQALEGPSAITTSDNDPVFLAKALTECSKGLSEFKISGGFVYGKVSLSDEVKALAKIPSREIVLTQILLGISAPLIQISCLFSATIRDLYLVLLAVKEKKEV